METELGVVYSEAGLVIRSELDRISDEMNGIREPKRSSASGDLAHP
jgi:hypothetical protein